MYAEVRRAVDAMADAVGEDADVVKTLLSTHAAVHDGGPGGEGEPGDSRERRVTRSAGLSAAAGGGVPLCRLFLGNRSLSAGWCVGRSVVQQSTCRSFSSSAGGRTVGRGIQLRGRALSLSLAKRSGGAGKMRPQTVARRRGAHAISQELDDRNQKLMVLNFDTFFSSLFLRMYILFSLSYLVTCAVDD